VAQRNLEEVAILLHPADSVAVLKRPLKPSDEVLLGSKVLHITSPIGAGHKIALSMIADGAPVKK